MNSTHNNEPTTLRYYLNNNLLNNKKNRNEFKRRANDLGFKGQALRNNEITKTYIKYFNKTYKDLYKLKSVPFRNGTFTKPASSVDSKGGYYLQTINKYYQNNEPVNINITKPENMTKLLESVLLKNKDMILTFTDSNGNKTAYTLNKDTTRRLQDIINSQSNVLYSMSESESQSSDSQLMYTLTNSQITNIELSPPVKKKKISGAFFRYLHNIPELNLLDLQIYNNVEEINPNSVCCFIQCLLSAGVNDYIISQAKSLIKCRDIPTCLLNEICLKLHLHITVNKISDNKIIHYPNGKSKLAEFIKDSKTAIKIGLIDEHYFHIKKIPITSYAINYYQDIKHIKDFHKIYKKSANGSYKKSNDRFIDSFSVIKLLYNNKTTLLKPITSCNEIYSTNYYDMINDIESLEYTEENVRPVAYEPKKDKDNHVNIFADFETTTDQYKHIPYCLHIRNNDLQIQKTFIGTDCAKKALYYLSKLNMNIRFIFHNAGYDVRFMYEYLTHFKAIERGKFLLRGYAQFYYGEKQYYKIQIQDSYALIPEPLRNFKNMFNLPVEKEILPYGLYTQENVDKGIITESDCIKSVKEQFIKNNIGKTICLEQQEQFVNEFLENVKKWNCYIDNDKIDIIRYSVKYCEMDCVVLEQGYNIFRNNILKITQNHINIDLYVSVASLSLDYMKIKNVFDNVFELSGNPREFINKCMYGGRTMCSENKKIDNPPDQILADMDAISLYPSAMSRLQGYLQGTPKVIKNLEYENIKNYDGYFVEIMIEKVNKKFKFPLMSKITDKGIREWTNEMENEIFYCDKTTLEELIKYHDIEYKIIRGYYYNEGRNMNLKPTIEHLFNTRLEAKKQKNPIEKIYKLIMNSCYGKCLLKPIDTEKKYISNGKYKEFISTNYNWIKDSNYCKENNSWKITVIKPINEHFNLVHCGIEVLSMSKRIMNEVMVLAELLGIDMYYTDTDSIHIDNSKIDYLATEFKKKYGRDLIGKNLGHFHSDFSSDIVINGIMDKINSKNNTNLKFKDLTKEEKDKYENSILAKRSIFLAKKCYIDELYSEYTDKVDYHIRLKGIPNASILDYAYNNNITPYQIYEKLLNNEEIIFDMTCGGKKINFKFHNDMTISTLDEFNRKISFQ